MIKTLNKLIVYIEAHDATPMNFGNKTISYLQKHYKNNTLLDLDNFSSSDLFSHALKACQEETKVTLIIKTKSDTVTLGPILQFINKLIRIPSITIDSLLLSKHPTLERMLKKLHSFEVCTPEDLIKDIKKPR